MPLDYLSFSDFKNIITAEFSRVIPSIDPTVHGSWARGFNDGVAAAAVALQGVIQDLEKYLFPQTATDDGLDDRWGSYENLPRNPATGATGVIAQTGTVGTTVPVNTKYRASNGVIYSVVQIATITAQVGSILSLTRMGSITTVTTATNHNLGNGQKVVISGADQPEYNGTFQVTVLSADSFTYEISGMPVTPATGTIQYSSDFASITIQADSTGSGTNLDSGASLTLVSELAGITEPAIVNFEGLVGGTSKETDEAYRQRIILSRSLIEGVFTSQQVELAALGISGNTRAFVVNPTLSVCPGAPDNPVPGQVVVYILRDNDPSILPNATILAQTKEAIINNGKMPAHTSEVDVFVLAPTLVITNFDFIELTPNTPTMQSAVINKLRAFFEDSVMFGSDVRSDSYRGAIQNTQDLVTGQFLISFELSTPVGDIIVGSGEIAVIGDITFSIAP